MRSTDTTATPADGCRRIAITVGGTAGHVYPAVAIAQAYQRVAPAVEVCFIGTRGGFAERIAASTGCQLFLIPGSPFFRSGPTQQARALAEAVIGATRARHILRAEGSSLVIGTGGFASAGALAAARGLGIPTAILESNASPGLTNRLLARFVDRVYLGCDESASHFRGCKTVFSGTPIRAEIAALAAAPRHPPVADGPVRVLVTGGSEGSPFLNRQVPVLLGRVAQLGVGLEVRHQCGGGDAVAIAGQYRHAGIEAQVSAYIDDFAGAYVAADFAVTCAGAGTLAELAAAGPPALLVPLSGAARDHQAANAKQFADATGAWWVREDDWEPEALAQRLVALIRTPAAWAAASKRLRQHARPDAAQALVADCEMGNCRNLLPVT